MYSFEYVAKQLVFLGREPINYQTRGPTSHYLQAIEEIITNLSPPRYNESEWISESHQIQAFFSLDLYNGPRAQAIPKRKKTLPQMRNEIDATMTQWKIFFFDTLCPIYFYRSMFIHFTVVFRTVDYNTITKFCKNVEKIIFRIE